MNKTYIRCTKCRQETNIDNDTCPFCGQNLKNVSRFGKANGKVSVLVIFILIVYAVPNIIISRSFKDDVMAFLPEATVSSAFVFLSENVEEKFDTANTFDSNTDNRPIPDDCIKSKYGKKFKVGKDIAAGEYLLTTLDTDEYASCKVTIDVFSYYDKHENYVPEGVTHKNVYVAWEIFETNYIVTIQNGQTFYIENCAAIPLASADASLLPKNGSGAYKVGVNLEAGEYVLFRDNDAELSDSSYIVSTTSSGTYAHRVYSGFFKENAIVTVHDGEYLYLNECYMVPIDEAEVDTSRGGTFKIGTHIDAGKYIVSPANEEKHYDYSIYTDGRLTEQNKKCYCYGKNANNQMIELNDGEYIVLDYMYLIPQ